MRAAFSDDQLDLADAVRIALSAECDASALRACWETPRDYWPLLAEQGVLGLTAPEACGGLGLGALDWVSVVIEAGKVALPAPLGEHLALVELLAGAGERDLVERMATGEARVTCGFAPEPGPIRLFGHGEDEAVIALGPAGAWWVEEPTRIREPGADRSLHLATVQGSWRPVDGDASAAFDRAVLANAATLVGLAETILDLAVDYAKARRQFGKPIGSFQAVQHHLVDALLARRFAAPVVHRAAHSLATGDPDRSLHVAMAKIYAARAAELACRKSLQVHGAIGYTFEYDLHLYMKRAWTLCAAWGDAAWHRDRAARAVMGGPHA